MQKKLFIGAASVAIAAAAMPAQAQDRTLGDIFLVGYTFCPRGSTEAAGQIMSISTNTALFSLYGTTYGGNGQTTFALPDLRSRSPVGQGQGPGLSNFVQGQVGGVENITLTINQMPQHNHDGRVRGSTSTPNSNSPSGNTFATFAAGTNQYTNGPDNVTMADEEVQITRTGGSQPFENRNPYLALRYCVALEGIFPSRN
ncbi:MAG: phage tail protein [Parasphingopyxis sp.]|nr:tail fiber protein [Sphingomonadales bacterium]